MQVNPKKERTRKKFNSEELKSCVTDRREDYGPGHGYCRAMTEEKRNSARGQIQKEPLTIMTTALDKSYSKREYKKTRRRDNTAEEERYQINRIQQKDTNDNDRKEFDAIVNRQRNNERDSHAVERVSTVA